MTTTTHTGTEKMRVFLSYSRQDAPIVQEFYLMFKDDQHVAFWFDQVSIETGEDWSAAIKRGLDECDAVILFGSKFAFASTYVKNEWIYAVRTLHKPLFVWLIDSVEIDPDAATAIVHDIRRDPFDIELWRDGLALLSGSVPASTSIKQDVLPPYIQHYVSRIRRWRNLWIGITALWVGIMLALVVPQSGQITWLLALIVLVLALGLDTAVNNRVIRRTLKRRYPWNDRDLLGIAYFSKLLMSSFYANLLLFDFSSNGDAVLYELSGKVVIGYVFLAYTVAFPLFTIIYPRWPQWFLGEAIFPYQNTELTSVPLGYAGLSQWYNPFPLLGNTLLKGHRYIRQSKIYGWMPAFEMSGKLQTATSDNPYGQPATYEGKESIESPDKPETVDLLYHSADRYFVDYVVKQLGYPPRLKRIMCDAEGGLPVGESSGVLVIVLSQYSLPYVREIYSQAERTGVPYLITIQLDEVGERLQAEEKYQRVEVRSWNFGTAVAELQRLLETGSKSYSASVDVRAFKGRSYAKALTYTFFYSAALFCVGHAALVSLLFQRVPDLKGQVMVVLAPILCYGSGAFLLFQTALRRYTLKYAAVVLVCIEILSISYGQFLSNTDAGYKLSGMIAVLVLAGAFWAPVLALMGVFSDRLRHQDFRLLDRFGVKDTRLHPLSMVIWEPYRPGDGRLMLIFIPLFLFAMLMITMV